MFRFKKWSLWIGLIHHIIGLSQWVGDVFKIRGQTWLPIAPHLRPHGFGNAPTMGFMIALRGLFFLRLLLAHKVLLWIILAWKRPMKLAQMNIYLMIVIEKACQVCHASWTIIFFQLECYNSFGKFSPIKNQLNLQSNSRKNLKNIT